MNSVWREGGKEVIWDLSESIKDDGSAYGENASRTSDSV